jgi:hypothetical protein
MTKDELCNQLLVVGQASTLDGHCRLIPTTLLREAICALRSNISDWKSVDTELPSIGSIVQVSYKSGFDDKPVFAWGARLEGDEGWCWGVEQMGGGIRPDEDAMWNNIDTDDEYRVTHWMPLPSLPDARPA